MIAENALCDHEPRTQILNNTVSFPAAITWDVRSEWGEPLKIKQYAFEIWLLPRTHDSCFEDAQKREYQNLSRILKSGFLRIDQVLDHPPHNLVIHTSPITETLNDFYHWHVEIMPKLSKVAGFELGTWSAARLTLAHSTQRKHPTVGFSSASTHYSDKPKLKRRKIMRRIDLQTTSSSFPTQPKKGTKLMITRRIFWTLIGTGMMIISTTAVNAQRVNREDLMRISKGGDGTQVTTLPAISNESSAALVEAAAASLAQEADQGGPPKKQAIVGSWLETVTFSGGVRPPLKSLSTMTADGGFVVADQGSVTTEPPTVFSAAHGAWVHLGGRTFAWTVLELISDLSGNLLATLKVRGQYIVNESGNSYTGQFKAEVADTAGNLLFSVEGTNAGQRIQVEPLTP
jgi:hypothetical protein